MSEYNSYANYIQGLYRAMYVDIACKLPSLRVDCERDLKRLLSISKTDGLPFFMITLPEFGKHFDQCLSNHSLSLSRLPHFRAAKRRGVIPQLFKGLLQRIFGESGELKDQPCLDSISFVRQLCYAVKRFGMRCPDSATWRQIDEFYKVEGEIEPPSSYWTGEQSSADSLGHRDLHDVLDVSLPLFRPFGGGSEAPLDRLSGAFFCVQSVADLVASELGWFDPAESRLKHGPGAVSDRRPGMTKYLPGWWPDVLESQFPLCDYGYHNHLAAAAGSLIHTDTPVFAGASKLIAVPKTLKAPRLIAAEPTANQWCQQAILNFMYKKVSHTSLRRSVNFRSQIPNQVAALRASIDGSSATIDLKSASDRISCGLVERMFRRNHSLLDALRATRTQFILNELDRKHPRLHRLRKFSTMGSAVTFPIQSYIFACIAIGCFLFESGLSPTPQNIRRAGRMVRVFGDDMIVPTTSWQLTQETLEALGLRVNILKTFGVGKFRESCGCDAYSGVDVTPIGVLSTPDVSRPGSVMSSVDSHNNFLSKGYFATADYIKSTVQGLRRLTIPSVPIDSGAFGWHSTDPWAENRLRKRFNSLLQRVEVFVHVPLAKNVRTPTEVDQMLLQYFTEVCKPPLSREERLGIASAASNKLVRRWVPERDLGLV